MYVHAADKVYFQADSELFWIRGHRSRSPRKFTSYLFGAAAAAIDGDYSEESIYVAGNHPKRRTKLQQGLADSPATANPQISSCRAGQHANY